MAFEGFVWKKESFMIAVRTQREGREDLKTVFNRSPCRILYRAMIPKENGQRYVCQNS